MVIPQEPPKNLPCAFPMSDFQVESGNPVSAGVCEGPKAETFASADYADDLEFGTHKMAPRPAMRPAFEETKPQALADIAKMLRNANRA